MSGTQARRTPGERIGVLEAVPQKRTLRDAARKLEVRDAVGEIVDNALDNFAKQGRLNRPADRLLIDIDMSNDEVRIRENSGGVTPTDLMAFVQLGSSGADLGAARIGVWGAGQKVAVAALGADVRVSTRYWNPSVSYEIGGTRTDQVEIRMGPSWWADEQDWAVPVTVPESDIPNGETLYVIRDLNRRIDPDVIDDVRRHVADIYGDTLTDGVTEINVNGVSVDGVPYLTESALQGVFAYPHGFEPTEHWFNLEDIRLERDGELMVERPHKLAMRITVGIMPEQSKDVSGVYMFGVPEGGSSKERIGARLFGRALQDESVGYAAGPRSILRRGDPTLGRLRVYVVFYGQSEDIPWGMPGSAVKWGYYSANPYAEAIKNAIKDVAKPYVRFTQKARRIDILPFSERWSDMSVADRKAEVRRGARLSAPEDIDEPGVVPLVKSFVTSEFKPTPFKQWDHSKSELPPDASPSFDEKLTKDVVSAIQEREKRLREIDGSDPVEAVGSLMDSFSDLKDRQASGWESHSAGPDDGGEGSVGGKPVAVSLRVPRDLLSKLTQKADTTNRSEAILLAIRAYLSDAD